MDELFEIFGFWDIVLILILLTIFIWHFLS